MAEKSSVLGMLVEVVCPKAALDNLDPEWLSLQENDAEMVEWCIWQDFVCAYGVAPGIGCN
eukprot:1286472-Ditylum_brightwellii.AAC.1